MRPRANNMFGALCCCPVVVVATAGLAGWLTSGGCLDPVPVIYVVIKLINYYSFCYVITLQIISLTGQSRELSDAEQRAT